jgi:site-specific DNA-methyltransferase (adenine-specific)
MKTESALLEKGRESSRVAEQHLLAELGDLDLVPVQRNRGMDAILREQVGGRPVALRVQREGESLEHAAKLLERAGRAANCRLLVLVARAAQATGAAQAESERSWPEHLIVIQSARAQLERALARLSSE